MSQRFASLSDIQRDILFLLIDHDSSTGASIQTALEEYWEDSVTNNKFYPNINTLVEQGLVTKEPGDGRSFEYSLTIDGKQAIKNRIEWQNRRLP